MVKYNYNIDYDLHIHTKASDGTLTPSEVVIMAQKKGLLGISITDHDTIDGLLEGQEKANELGIEFINGIELSTNYYGNDVHILGYFLNLNDEIFLNELKKIGDVRSQRNLKIIEKLKKNKLNIEIEDVIAEAAGDIVSRLHFAKVLMNKGYAYTKDEAFHNYLGKNGLAYVEKHNFSPVDAIKILKNNGAFVVLAHPKLYSNSLREVERLVKELKEVGLLGIEVNYPSFTFEERKNYNELAKKHNLLITGGSDFHGHNRENIEIGTSGIDIFEMDKIKYGRNRK